MKKVLVIGAGGMTGVEIIKKLSECGMYVKAFDHKAEKRDMLMAAGASEVAIGDMENAADVEGAMIGADVVYHITSAFNINEYEIGKISVDAAKKYGISHYVYQSVLHSNMSALVHHKKKNMVEEYLAESGLNYTVLCPAIFMQNIMRSWDDICKTGIFRQKFFSEKNSALCMVDLEDFAEAVSIVIKQADRHYGATYELCGPEMLRVEDVKSAIEKVLGRTIEMDFISDEIFASNLKKAGLSDYVAEGMLRMYTHYNEYDFWGNSFVLENILGRKPHTLEECLRIK